jgi:hypothetical protein
LHAYAPFPDEGLLRASVVSSLFPRLTSRSRAPFRVAFFVFAVALIALAAARLEAGVIAVSAVGIPLLFICYIVETGPLEMRFVGATLALFAVGGALGVAFSLVLGRTVADALLPIPSPSLTSGVVLRSAVLAPGVAQLLMVAPIAMLRLQRPARSEALDGFTAGAASALGLVCATTLTELAARVQAGNVAHGPVVVVLATAVIRGVSAPLVAAALTGWVGATLWARHDGASTIGGRWLTSPVLALGMALVLQVGLGFTDVAVLSDYVLLVVHLAAAVVALGLLRVGLHHVLLHERHDPGSGVHRLCPNCYRTVPAMPFCPACGVAEGATALEPRPLYGDGEEDGIERSVQSTGAATPTLPAPTSRLAGQTAHFAMGSRHEVLGVRRLGHRRLLAVLGVGLGAVCALFVVLAVLVPAPAPTPCASLRCFTPFGPVPLRRGTTYTSTQGWGLTWYPASDVFDGPAPSTAATSSGDELRLAFSSSTTPAEDGDLFFVGEPAQGQNAAQLVTALQQANVPNATVDYVLPNPTIGYHIGYGTAFETTPNSVDGYGITYEVVITCAVVNDYAICVYGVGPRVDVSTVVNHPTPSELALSLWSDADVNAAFWSRASG